MHEGKILDNQGNILHNRATIIQNIVAAIDATQPKLFDGNAKGATYFQSKDVRHDWANYAARQVAEDAASAGAWWTALKQAGMSPDGLSSASPDDVYYPVFPNPDLDKWLAADASTLAGSLDEYDPGLQPRLLAVVGPPGAGKSFALRLARARCAADEIVIIPSGVASQLPLRDMAQQLAPDVTFDERWRSLDGQIRNTYAETILNHYESLAANNARGQLTIAVELEEGAYWQEVEPFWLQFSILCAQRSRLKMLLCAPPQDLTDELLTHEILGLSEPRTLKIGQVNSHIRTVSEQRGIDIETALTRAKELWDAPNRLGVRMKHLALIDAARIVLQVAHELSVAEHTT
ncbi:hypothetical protein OKW30_008269 [Paraburkholderia sp. Clong3]|uniref:hypothetical protein n=1 Tax=Paraburkholderia sp. Clong3 TaxID=2991061 RepID=UPI003D1F83D0